MSIKSKLKLVSQRIDELMHRGRTQHLGGTQHSELQTLIRKQQKLTRDRKVVRHAQFLRDMGWTE